MPNSSFCLLEGSLQSYHRLSDGWSVYSIPKIIFGETCMAFWHILGYSVSIIIDENLVAHNCTLSEEGLRHPYEFKFFLRL